MLSEPCCQALKSTFNHSASVIFGDFSNYKWGENQSKKKRQVIMNLNAAQSRDRHFYSTGTAHLGSTRILLSLAP